MKKQNITIKEVARLAKTSRGTVDRVINNRGNVNSEVAKRVMDVIKETGYEKSFIAKRLSSDRDLNVGVIVGTINNSFFQDVLTGIRNGINRYYDYGLNFIIKEVDLNENSSIYKAVDELKGVGCDLLIVTASDNEMVCKKINELKCKKVALNRDLKIEDKLCFIGSDYYNCGCLIGNLFNLTLTKENSQLGIVIGSVDHVGQLNRLKGLKNTLNNNISIVKFVENFDNDEFSYKVTKKLINETHLDAICFIGAGIGGGLRAISESQQKLEIITVDQSKSVKEGLKNGTVTATIGQHPYSQGFKSVEIAFNYLVKELNIVDKIYENTVYLKESIIPEHN